MSIILTDIASVLDLAELSENHTKITQNIPHDKMQLLQNLILCDSIIISKRLAEKYGVLNICNLYEGVFDFIESFLSDQADIINSDISIYQEHAYDSLRIGSGKQRAFILGAVNYLNIASKLNVYYCPHSYRNKIVNSLSNYDHSSQISEKAISYFEQQLSKTAAFNLAGIDLKVPAVAEYALNFANTNKCSLSTAVNEIRNWKSTKNFRIWCNKMDEVLSSSSNRASFQKIQKMPWMLH